MAYSRLLVFILGIGILGVEKTWTLQTPPAGLSRPNYGVDFNFLFAVNNMHGSWKHIWTVDLSLLDRTIKWQGNLQCEMIQPLCKPATEMFEKVSAVLLNATSSIQQGFSWAHNPQILSTLNRGLDKRRKRALLPFIGDIEKFFFGTATESDIAGLKDTLEDMERVHKMTIDHVSELGDNLASLTKIVNEQTQNSKKGFELIRGSLENLTSQVNARFHDLSNTLARESDIVKYNSLAVAHTWAMLEHVLPKIVEVSQLLNADIQLVDGIQTILQGFIPISFIPPLDLQRGLQVALEGVRSTFPSASLTHSSDNLGYYYTHKIVTPYFEPDRISLIVDIPIDLSQDILYVYAIRTFPIAILPYNPYSRQIDPQSKAGIAMAELNTKFTHFLISEDGQQWSAAKDQDISSCIGESVRSCKHQFPLYPFNTGQCLEHLWNNSPFEKILETCNYQISHVMSPMKAASHISVIPLSHGRWYIEAPLDEQWTIQCPSRSPERRASCTSCVIQVDCGCGIRSRYFRIPTRVSSCESVFSPLRRNFTINPFNYHPSSEPWIVNLTGDDSLDHPPRMKPDITLPDHGVWDDVLEDMSSRSYDLNKLYESQKNATNLFRTEAEALLQKIRNQDKLLSSLSSWPDWTLGLVIFLTFGNSIVLIFMCFCIFGRVRAKSIGEELDLIASEETAILTIEGIILIISSVSFFLLVLMSWPIIRGWMVNSKLYKTLTRMGPTIKAVGVRVRRGCQMVKMSGTFHFYQEGKQVSRMIPGVCVLAFVPNGTHLEAAHANANGIVTLDGNTYQLQFGTPLLFIRSDDSVVTCDHIEFYHDYVHRKLNVPMSSRWTRWDQSRVWVD